MPDKQLTLCLKVDVDTSQGLLVGVPRLADLLRRQGLRATFCIAMGPDRSGRAVRRFFTQKGFLAKMVRTRAHSAYGLRTSLYGTLLPSPNIGLARPDLIRSLQKAGHEVIVHGFDHVSWHDYLGRWDEERIRVEMSRAARAFESVAGHPCMAFAAPGWQATEASLRIEQEMGLSYASDTRGWCPFLPLVDGAPSSVPQLPTTLPTLDELLADPAVAEADLLDHVLGLCERAPAPLRPGAGPPGAAHVFTAHAEIEGKGWIDWFEQFLLGLRQAGAEFFTLAELAAAVTGTGAGVPARVVAGRLPGRAGTVACQEGWLRD